jgi:hypothetical protein
MGRGRGGRRVRRRRSSRSIENAAVVKPAGADNQLVFNNKGAFGAVTPVTFDDTDINITDDTKLNFGTDNDAFIQFDEQGNDHLIISGSSKGIALSGSSVYVDQKMGVGVSSDNITHAITLPDNADNSGKIKANAFMTYSSARFKEDVQVIDNPIETIQNLRGVTFTWKKNSQKDYGFIAEEVGKELPIIVEWDTEDNPQKPRAMSMDYTRIIPFLLEGIKSQQKQIDSLKDEIKVLKRGTEAK